jgi:hypothetical protein
MEMKGLSIQAMSNILAEANKKNLYSYDAASRVFGAIEGILLCYGKLTPGKPWVFKEFDVEVTGWFGKKTIEKRKQTYRELMVELLIQLIDEEVNKLKQLEDENR